VRPSTRKPNLLEQIAYRDTWGRGADSFIAMIYERLVLMRDLLHPEGSIYVHCDWRVNAYMRTALDEVFRKRTIKTGEIIWQRTNARGTESRLAHVSMTPSITTQEVPGAYFNSLTVKADFAKTFRIPLLLVPDGRKYQSFELTAPGVTQSGKSGESLAWL